MPDVIDIALAEDVGAGDLTTRLVVPAGATATAVIEQRAPGVPAGLDVAREVFLRVDPSLEFTALADASGWREPGPLAEVSGAAGSILTAERTALNFLGRLGGRGHPRGPLRAGGGGHGGAHPRHPQDHAGAARPREGRGARRRRREPPARASTTRC